VAGNYRSRWMLVSGIIEEKRMYGSRVKRRCPLLF
jgi:hypothetical protein